MNGYFQESKSDGELRALKAFEDAIGHSLSERRSARALIGWLFPVATGSANQRRSESEWTVEDEPKKWTKPIHTYRHRGA